MLNRYIGNKKELLSPIMKVVTGLADADDLVCDIFSGTLAVSVELKRLGFRVATNDINLFSYHYANALLSHSRLPEIYLDELVPRTSHGHCNKAAECWAQELKSYGGYGFLSDEVLLNSYTKFLALLVFLDQKPETKRPAKYNNQYIFDFYTEEGRFSAFESARGKKGKRRFFSPANAKRIDIVLNQIRRWKNEKAITDQLYSMLLCSLLDGIERIANTQGTYHDFPRDTYDPRSLKSFKFIPLSVEGLIGKSECHIVGRELDSLDFIQTVPAHKVIYIDPPYNFRQYTSYYFLPNLLCRYCEIEDLEEYFAGLSFVRGQNMNDDFASTFCKSSQFINSLAKIIENARSEFVVLSYFDGRNHWNQFDTECNGVGYEKLTELFSSSLFTPNSLKTIPVERLNYQSYGGYKAKTIREFLFVAEKRNKSTRAEPQRLAVVKQ
jgi:adenine-specific DNA-methyltransferase